MVSSSDTALYGYIPTRSTAIIFIALFGISTIIHSGQGIRFRTYWMFPTACLCGFLEVLGWSARLWSSFSPREKSPFQIQITATIIGPTPLLAANFMILGEIIKILGPDYSRLSPKWYTILFCSCDVISLFIQAAGGGIAASAPDIKGANRGAKLMLAGIIFQLIVIVIFSFCALEYFIRYNLRKPLSTKRPIRDDKNSEVRGHLTGGIRIMTYALILTTTCLFIRAIYRVIELADGWKGRIIETEVYFNVLDGAMIVLAMCTTNFFHPGMLLVPQNQRGLSTTV